MLAAVCDFHTQIMAAVTARRLCVCDSQHSPIFPVRCFVSRGRGHLSSKVVLIACVWK